MSRSRPFASMQSTRGLGALIVAFAVVGLALAAPPVAPAQFGGPTVVAQNIKIKSPVASQVFQRDVNGRAVIPIALDESDKDATLVDAAVVAENRDPTANKQPADRVTWPTRRYARRAGESTRARTVTRRSSYPFRRPGPAYWPRAGAPVGERKAGSVQRR